MRSRNYFILLLTVIITLAVGMTRQVLAAVPAAPVLSSPADGMTTTSHTLSVSWGSVSGATSYDVEIGDSIDFTNVVRSAVGTTVCCSYSVTNANALPDGVYYWHVRAKNVDVDGGWSLIRSFTIYTLAPGLISPADGMTTTSHTLAVSWGSTMAAVNYDVQISDTSAFANIIRSATATTVCCSYSITNANPLPDGVYYWRVRINTIASTGPWSEIRRFAIYTLAPGLISPADGMTMTSHTLAVSWGSTMAAVSYDVQISDTSGFTNVVGGATATTVCCSYSITNANPLPDGVYYWRVRINTITGIGPWSVIRSFTIYTIGPTLISPADGTTFTTHMPSVSWGSTMAAVNYDIEFADTSGFTNVIWRTAATTVCCSYSFTSINPLPNNIYYWRVRINTITGAGPWSQYRRFSINTSMKSFGSVGLASPANAFVTNNTTPMFSWSPIGGSDWYHFQIDNNLDFGSLAADINTNITSLTLTTPLPDGLYYWRVQAADRTNSGAYSETRVIIIYSTLMGAPSLTAPADGSVTDDSTPIFTWSAVNGAMGYHLEVDNNLNFGSLERDVFVGAGELSHVLGTALPDGLYYWRVRATTSVDSGAWSQTRTFSIITALTGKPNLTAPADGAIVNISMPIFSWDAVPNASGYHIQIDTVGDFVTPVRNITLTDLAYTPPTALANGLYYWRVQATGGPWSDVWTVQIQSEVVSPPNAAPPRNYFGTGTPTLTWSAVSWATSYELEVASDMNFQQIVYSYSGSELETQVQPALTVGTYYWRVRAVGANGSGNWSAVDSFVIGS